MSFTGTRKSILLLTACLVFLFTTGFQILAYEENDDCINTASISLCLRDPVDDSLINGACFCLYQVAVAGGVNDEELFSFMPAFQACGLDLDLAEAGLLARRLATYAKEHRLEPTDQRTTDDGRLCFSDLEDGLYLIVQEGSVAGYCAAAPFLVTLPLLNADGSLTYKPEAFPKIERRAGPESPVSYPTEPELTSPEVTEPDPEIEPESSLPLATDRATEPAKTDSPDLDQPRLIQTGQVNWPVPLMATAGFFLFTYGWRLFYSKKTNEDETVGSDTSKSEAENDDKES